MARPTVADLYVPRNVLPPSRMVPLRDALFGRLWLELRDPRNTTGDRLSILGAAVLPMAQILLGMGTAPAVAIEHAAELLESMFLADALIDSPELLLWFAD